MAGIAIVTHRTRQGATPPISKTIQTNPKNPMKKTLLLTTLLAAGLVGAAQTQAAVLAQFNFDNGSAASSDSDGDSTASAFTFTSGITETSAGSGAGPDGGISAAGNAFLRSDATGANQAAALADDDFFSFTLTAATGQFLDLTSLTLALGGTTAATATPPNPASASFNNAVFLLANGVLIPGTNTTSTVPANSTTAVFPSATSFDLTGVANTPSATFQIRFSDNANTSNQINRIDNVIVNGSVIPEPTTAAMLLGGVGMLTLLRRRRA